MSNFLKSLKFSLVWVALLLLAGWLFFFYVPGCNNRAGLDDAAPALAAPETVVVYKDRIIQGRGYAKKKDFTKNNHRDAESVDTALAAVAGRLDTVAYCYDDSLLALELVAVGDSLRVSYWIKQKERELQISDPYPVFIRDTSALRLYVGSLASAERAGVMLQLQSNRVAYMAGYDLSARAALFGISIRLVKFERRKIRNISPVRLKRRPGMGVSGLLNYESDGDP